MSTKFHYKKEGTKCCFNIFDVFEAEEQQLVQWPDYYPSSGNYSHIPVSLWGFSALQFQHTHSRLASVAVNEPRQMIMLDLTRD